MEVDTVGIIAILGKSYITTRLVKTEKCGKNPQRARRKSNYHTKCGKNCHKRVLRFISTVFKWCQQLTFSLTPH